MSHTFYLSNVTPISIKAIESETGFDDIKFLHGYVTPEDDNWPSGISYIYRDQVSARTVEVEREGHDMNVRIFAASSPEDYQLGMALVIAAAKLSGARITPEDNKEMNLEALQQLYGIDWIKDHCNSSVSMVLARHVREPDSEGTISGVHSSITVGSRVIGQLMQDESRAASEFFTRLRKLNYIDSEDIYQASLLSVENDTGDKLVRLSTYTEGVPTLIQDADTVITLTSDLLNPDTFNRINLPAAKLADIMGAQAVWLSEDMLLLPGVEGEDWQQLLKQAQQASSENIFDFGYAPDEDRFKDKFAIASSESTSTAELSDEDIRTLGYAPVIVFFMVAASDGEVDDKEIKTFQGQLFSGILAENELMQTIMVQAAAGFEEMSQALTSEEVNPIDKLTEITAIIDHKIAPQQGLNFKHALLKLGLAVAEASGGFLGIFGSKVSKEERRALAGLAVLLGVELG